MCKLISFVCVLIVAVATTSYGLPMFVDPINGSPPTLLNEPIGPGTGGVLVGDWQQCFDHWTLTSDDMGGMVGFSTTGATRNGKSLMWFASAGGWSGRLMLKLENYVHSDVTPTDQGRKDVDIFGYNNQFNFDGWLATSNYDTFEADVTPVANTQLLFVFNYGGLNAGVGAGGWGACDLSAINLPGGVTTSVKFNFSGTECSWGQGKTDWVNLLSQGYVDEPWVELMLIDIGDATTMYIDNARLTPEPATIALLGLGGLSLIRRKR